MANFKTVALTNEEYRLIIETINSGFVYGDGKKFRPNRRLSFALQLEANLGIRISDVLNLKLSDIVRDGNRWRLDITEIKTGKKRTFKVNDAIYSFISNYCRSNNISSDEKIVNVSERAIEKQLKIVVDHLGLYNISTHSFRKYFAMSNFENSGYNVRLVQELLQHQNINTTTRYLTIRSSEIEKALDRHTCLI